MVGRLACSLLLSSRPAPPPLLGSIRVCGGSWEGLVQVVVWALVALVGTPTTQVLFRPLLPPLLQPLSRCIETRSGKAAFPAYYCTSSPRQAEQTQCGLERRLEQIRSAARNNRSLFRVRLNIQPQPGTVKLRYAVMLGPPRLILYYLQWEDNCEFFFRRS